MKKLINIAFTFLLAAFMMTSCGLFESDKTYTLTTTASPQEGGTISPSEGEFGEGKQITLLAEPNEWWQFVRWEGDWNGTMNPAELTMSKDYSITAVFEKMRYSLNITIKGEGIVREVVIQQKASDYEHGTLVRLTAKAAEGWYFVEWSGDAEGEDRSYEIMVDEEKNVTAKFEEHIHNGTAVVEVSNPETGRVWMDRNLGASRAATSSSDSRAHGGLYQWGRAVDGHQRRNSPTTSTLSSSNQPAHGSFILAPNSPSDWRSPQNNNLWQGINGINNPCPAGYRLPTEAEWDAERNSWSSNNASGALNSPLKLPLAGGRSDSRGSLFLVGSYGYYWSSTVAGSNARFLFFFSGNARMYSNGRAYGSSVRCIKDE